MVNELTYRIERIHGGQGGKGERRSGLLEVAAGTNGNNHKSVLSRACPQRRSYIRHHKYHTFRLLPSRSFHVNLNTYFQ